MVFKVGYHSDECMNHVMQDMLTLPKGIRERQSSAGQTKAAIKKGNIVRQKQQNQYANNNQQKQDKVISYQ